VLCRGAARTGARRTGRSFKAELHCGVPPGVHGAAWPGVAELAGGGCAGIAMFGLAAGSVITPVSSTSVSNEPPWTTVADKVTAEPANSAPKVRAVGLQGMGEAGE
jgi:hypothetical protein